MSCQTTARHRINRIFLHHLLCDAGAAAALLYLVTLRQAIAIDLSKSGRANLCEQIQSMEIRPHLNTLAIQKGISVSVTGYDFARRQHITSHH